MQGTASQFLSFAEAFIVKWEMNTFYRVKKPSASSNREPAQNPLMILEYWVYNLNHYKITSSGSDTPESNLKMLCSQAVNSHILDFGLFAANSLLFPSSKGYKVEF